MSESRGTENASDTNAHRRQLASSRHESPRYNSQDQGSSDRTPRMGAQRVPSSSPDRFDARFPRFQQPESSPVTSPGVQEATRLLSRDFTEPNPSTSPTPRQSGNSAANPPASSIRRRLGSAYLSRSPDPSRSWRGFEPKKGSVAIAAVSGRDSDTASRRFSLAGPAPLESLVANQPYVDPGYAQLNPAYDQPANIRPVWGLAKPLPHVLRPGMVPSKDELKQEMQQQRDEQDRLDISEDLESGRIEPTLRPDRILPELDNIRRDREIRLFETHRQQYEASPAFSPFSRTRKGSSATVEVQSFHPRLEETIIEEDEEQPHQRRTSQQQPEELDLPHLSEAIASVNRAREEEDLGFPYQDAVPLPAYEAEDGEVHNLHTYWSVVRLRFREPLAELLGITIQYTLGFSANLSATVSQGTAGVNDTGAWAWGFATMVAIYISGGVSGAHFNPAISIMLYIYRGFPLQKVPIYIAAQLLGAILATMITFGIFRPGLVALRADQGLQLQSGHRPNQTIFGEMPYPEDVLKNFLTYPRSPWVTHSVAFVTELTGATILTVSVLALGDDTNAPPGAGMNAFIIGLIVTLLGMALGYNTGLALNPVRDFGPRLMMKALGYKMSPNQSLFEDWYWFKVACLGPVCGTIFGGFLYDSMIFVGGESPVNYPTTRIMRATMKWTKRWQARFARTKWKKKGGKDGFVGPT